MYSSRVEYYKQLKDEFQGAVIAYITGDRPGFETRIHVVSEDGIYKIIRLDPNHRVHE